MEKKNIKCFTVSFLFFFFYFFLLAKIQIASFKFGWIDVFIYKSFIFVIEVYAFGSSVDHFVYSLKNLLLNPLQID